LDAVSLAAAEAKAAAAERGIALVRLGVVAFNSILYVLAIYPGGLPWLAGTIIVVANVYSVVVMLWPPAFRTALLAASWTAVTDAVLIVLWLTATGAGTSPFWILWSVSIVAIAFRFGPAATRWVTAAYVAIDVVLLAAWGALVPLTPLFAVRIVYIGFFGLLATNMASSNLDALRRERRLAKTTAALTASQAELSAIVDNAPSFIVRCDPDGTIRFANRMPEGLRREDTIGRSALEFAHPDDKEQLSAAIRRVADTGHAEALQLRGTGPNGTEAWYRNQLAAILEAGQVVSVLMQVVDVTREKEQEHAAQEARQSRFELQQLQKEDAFRRQLLNSVAHELNTPLTPLKIQLEMLHRRSGGTEGIALLRRNVDRLARLVGDLLEVARFDAGKLELRREEFDLRDAIDDAAATFRPLAEARNISIEVDVRVAVMVVADRMRVTQILYNLISNAVKYSSDGTVVHVTATSEDGHAVCEVRDAGPGFTAAEREKLFQPFTQVHAPPPGQTGTGLGLYITKQLVEVHEGTIVVLSPGPGQGSTFRFTLPRP
jgi:PAS domain S-box-containing protein